MRPQAAGPAGAPLAAGIDDQYADWVRDHDTFTPADRAAILAALPRLLDPPLISLIIVPGYEPEVDLRHTLQSLREQAYPFWEVLIPGPEPDCAAETLPGDGRLRLLGGGPYPDRATAANSALCEAVGNYTALLTEGDRLAPGALFELADMIARHPDTEVLYGDEDRIDFGLQRTAPWLKSGWDPDLLLSQYYFGALALYRTARLEALGGWRSGYGLAEVYDLALRATADVLPGQVRHAASILVHRPAHMARTLRDLMCHDDAIAGRRAVAEFLGPTVQVLPAPLLPSCHRIVWPVPEPAPKVSIIMPTRDLAWLLGPAAWGVLLRTVYPDFELLIVDNNSEEPATAACLADLQRDPRVRVIPYPGPFNFSAINNAAVQQAAGEIIVLLNNDIDVIGADWLREMVSHAVRADVGAVGARLLYADGKLQHGGVVLGPGLNATHYMRLAERNDPGYAGQQTVTRNYSAVTGACFAIRRDVFLQVGGLDADNLAVAFNDVDLCLRLGDHGYRVVFTPFAEMFHLESQTRGMPDTPEKLAREMREVDHLWRTWRAVFDHDPFHNPNMTCAWMEPLHLCKPRRPRAWQRAE